MNSNKDRQLQTKLAEASKGIGQIRKHLAEYPDEANLAAIHNGLVDRRRKILAGIAKNDAAALDQH